MSSLHPRTHDVLLSAWRENRLAAVHIDLQTGFKVNDHVLDGVAKLTKSLKPLNINNIWVAYGRHHSDDPNITSNVKGIAEAGLPCGRIRNGLGAAYDDVAITKCHDSAFYHPNWPLHTHLSDTGKDTILVTGVYSTYCVAETLMDAILSDRYNIVAVGDCIDISEQTSSGYYFYAKWLSHNTAQRQREMGLYNVANGEAQKRYEKRFHLATSDVILEAFGQEKGPS